MTPQDNDRPGRPPSQEEASGERFVPYPDRIVIGQRIEREKHDLAKDLRRKMTPPEKALWQALRRNQLGVHFRRQQVVAGFIVDFYCHAAGLIVEVDGPVHEEQVDYDSDRDHVLADLGLRVLRVRNEEVSREVGAVLQQIAAAVQERRRT